MAGIPADELMNGLLIRTAAAGSVPERIGDDLCFRERVRNREDQSAERALASVITHRNLQPCRRRLPARARHPNAIAALLFETH